MSTSITRPTFYEGEILPAADLIATVNYPRDGMARHERYLHSWGVACGLDLQKKPADDGKGHNYVNVTVTAGLAVDGTGRQIVVPDDLQLSPADFQGEVVPLPPQPNVKPQDDPWYPVLLSGIDRAGEASSNLIGACASSEATRTEEAYEIHFGQPGSELNLDQQTTVGPADPPNDGSSNPWKVLIGFVQWSRDLPQFSDAQYTNATGTARRYVGVNAERVTSASGSLVLSTHPQDYTGHNPVMAIEIQEADKDGKLVFGKLSSNGDITPALTVTAAGDLTVAGKFSGAVTPGSVQVQSGVAFDGMVLPLPIGIDPADVTAGKVTLHIHVTPRMDQIALQAPPISAANEVWVPFPNDCRVDSDTLEVHCRMQWRDLAQPANPGPVLAAYCDYTVIAAVSAAKGSGS